MNGPGDDPVTRAKAGVAQLRAAGASDADVDAYLSDALGTPKQASDSTATRAPAPKSDAPSIGRAAVIGGLRGATFDFSDEIAGATAAALTGSSYHSLGDFAANYRRARDQMRGEQSAAQEAHPVATLAGTLAGGLLATGPTLGAEALAAKGAPLAARLLAGAKTGAVAGGVSGLGAGTGSLGSQLASGAAGAAGGAVLGGAIPAASAGASKVGRGVRNVVEAIRPVQGDARAAEQLAAALEKSGIAREQIPDYLRTVAAGGDDADLLLNRMPETVKRLARSVRSRPGRGSEIINERLNAQAVGDDVIPSNNARIAALSDEALGQQPVNAVDRQAALRKQAQDAAAPHYDQFRERGALPIEHGTKPEPPSVFDAAFADAEKRGVAPEGYLTHDEVLGAASPKTDVPVKEPDDLARLLSSSGVINREIGAVKSLSKYKDLPDHDARVLDAVYKRLGARADLEQNGAVRHDLGEELSNLRAAMTKRGAEYGTALDEYAAGSRVREAFETGQRMPMAATDVVDATARQYAHPIEADALRGGAASNIRQRAENSKLGGDIVGKLFGTPAAAKRLASLQPDDAKRAAFQSGIQREAQRIADRKLIQLGSNTADKQLEEQDFSTPAMSVLQQLVAGKPGRALVTAGSAAWQPLAEGRNRVTREALAQLLTASPTRDPETIDRFARLLSEALRKRAGRSGYGLLAAPVAGEEAGLSAKR